MKKSSAFVVDQSELTILMTGDGLSLIVMENYSSNSKPNVMTSDSGDISLTFSSVNVSNKQSEVHLHFADYKISLPLHCAVSCSTELMGFS